MSRRDGILPSLECMQWNRFWTTPEALGGQRQLMAAAAIFGGRQQHSIKGALASAISRNPTVLYTSDLI